MVFSAKPEMQIKHHLEGEIVTTSRGQTIIIGKEYKKDKRYVHYAHVGQKTSHPLQIISKDTFLIKGIRRHEPIPNEQQAN